MTNEVVRTPIIAELILALVVVIPTLGVQSIQRVRSRRNHPPSIQSFTSSKKTVDLCPLFPSGPCSSSGTIITLEVRADDPDNDNLNYKYSVSAGTIAGSGPTVNWDLTKSRLGTQTASVEVIDLRGGKTSRTTTVDLVVCGACDPGCPTLNVSCPTTVAEGKTASFEAWVSGDRLAGKLIYLWSHSNGKRSGGQKGPKLKIEAIGLPGDVITATVRILGLDPACNQQASCESRIEKRVLLHSEK